MAEITIPLEGGVVIKEQKAQLARDQAKAWYWANRERSLARSKAWRAENREKMAAYAKDWAVNNPESHKRAKAAWDFRNPEALRAKVRNRRAKRKLAGGAHSAQQVINLFAAQHGKCACCNVSIKKRYEVDHIVPIKLGGANDIGNIQLLCRPCNRRKSAKDPMVWARENGRLL